MTDEIIKIAINTFGIGGIGFAAAWFIARKLSAQYENRIQALELSSERCEQDRVSLRQTVIDIQAKVIAGLTKQLEER